MPPRGIGGAITTSQNANGSRTQRMADRILPTDITQLFRAMRPLRVRSRHTKRPLLRLPRLHSSCSTFFDFDSVDRHHVQANVSGSLSTNKRQEQRVDNRSISPPAKPQVIRANAAGASPIVQ